MIVLSPVVGYHIVIPKSGIVKNGYMWIPSSPSLSSVCRQWNANTSDHGTRSNMGYWPSTTSSTPGILVQVKSVPAQYPCLYSSYFAAHLVGGVQNIPQCISGSVTQGLSQSFHAPDSCSSAETRAIIENMGFATTKPTFTSIPRSLRK